MNRPTPHSDEPRASELAEAPAETAAPPSVRTGWRIALFFWITSFAFLLTYEWLSAIFKIVADLLRAPKGP